MPPKKNQINGFWLFAQSNKGKWKAQGLAVGTPQQLLALANPHWKSMTPDEKKQWDARAKEERRQKRGEGGDYERLDNTGQVIATRKDPIQEARKRREREIAETTSQWHGKDLTEEKFYFINFQDMCEVTEGDDLERRQWLPREMAIAEYSLSKGITNTYQQFIWPGGIPLGFRFRAEQKSSESHRIPIEKMEEDSQDYRAIFQRVLQVVGKTADGQYPPLYCLTKEYEKSKFLCDWLWLRSGVGVGAGNPLGKVHSLEDMVGQLLAFSGNPDTQNIATFQITSRLEGTQWDYIASTACDFHREEDATRHCSLSVVKKLAFTVSDIVAMHYNIELTENHVPVREEPEQPTYRVIPASRVASTGVGRGRGTRKPQMKQEEGGNGGANGGRNYTKLGQPCSGRESSGSEEEEGASSSSVGSNGRRPFTPPSAASIGRGGAYRAPTMPGGPLPGQFADWSKREAKPATATSGTDEDEDFPSLQMSGLRASNEPSVWVAGRGRGAVPATAVAAPSIRPPPGFGSVNLVGGRGFLPDGPSIRAAVPVGRGAMPSSANPQPAMGRGVPVGRGTMPTGAAQGPSFGRGRIPTAGRGARPGCGETYQPEGGASDAIGRGYLPTSSAAQMPSVRGQQGAAPRPHFEKEASAAERELGSSALPRAVQSSSGSAVLDVESDNFEPPLQQTDFPSQPLFQGGSVNGVRGVYPGAARGVTVGRGLMPTRGRGFMPKKEGNPQMS